MGQTNREKKAAAKKKARQKRVSAGWAGNESGECERSAMDRDFRDFLFGINSMSAEELEREKKFVHDLIEANKQAGYPDCDEMFGIPDDHFAAMPDDVKTELYWAATNSSMSRIDRFRAVFALSRINGLCTPMNLDYLEVSDA